MTKVRLYWLLFKELWKVLWDSSGLDCTGHSVRCIVIVLATDDKLSSGKPRKKREPKKPFRIDFNQISDEKQFSKSKVCE